MKAKDETQPPAQAEALLGVPSGVSVASLPGTTSCTAQGHSPLMNPFSHVIDSGPIKPVYTLRPATERAALTKSEAEWCKTQCLPNGFITDTEALKVMKTIEPHADEALLQQVLASTIALDEADVQTASCSAVVCHAVNHLQLAAVMSRLKGLSLDSGGEDVAGTAFSALSSIVRGRRRIDLDKVRGMCADYHLAVPTEMFVAQEGDTEEAEEVTPVDPPTPPPPPPPPGNPQPDGTPPEPDVHSSVLEPVSEVLSVSFLDDDEEKGVGYGGFKHILDCGLPSEGFSSYEETMQEGLFGAEEEVRAVLGVAQREKHGESAVEEGEGGAEPAGALRTRLKLATLVGQFGESGEKKETHQPTLIHAGAMLRSKRVRAAAGHRRASSIAQVIGSPVEDDLAQSINPMPQRKTLKNFRAQFKGRPTGGAEKVPQQQPRLSVSANPSAPRKDSFEADRQLLSRLEQGMGGSGSGRVQGFASSVEFDTAGPMRRKYTQRDWLSLGRGVLVSELERFLRSTTTNDVVSSRLGVVDPVGCRVLGTFPLIGQNSRKRTSVRSSESYHHAFYL